MPRPDALGMVSQMLRKIRSLFKIVKRNLALLLKSGRVHSRSRRSWLPITLLASFLVFVGIGLTQSHSPSSSQDAQLKRSVAIRISSQNVVEQIQYGGKVAYWLGAKSGYAYTLHKFLPNSIMISYSPKNSNQSESSQGNLSIETFDNFRSFDNSLHPLVDPDGRELVMTKDEIIEYNITSMIFEIVAFKSHPEIVVINYPNHESKTTLIANAESLQRVIPN